jgi:hypothetical protein
MQASRRVRRGVAPAPARRAGLRPLPEGRGVHAGARGPCAIGRGVHAARRARLYRGTDPMRPGPIAQRRCTARREAM